ncbi:MAG: anthranilate synthase component II [Phycisphaerales bacterium]
MVLLIDNYDSFTFNVLHLVAAVDPSLPVRVVRNDALTVQEAIALRPSHVIVSPGPCGPAEAGISTEAVRAFAGRVPILGICLGHQCIGAACGMTIERGPVAVHGKTSRIQHDGRGIFAGVPGPLTVMRYHSLVVREETIPDGWKVSAWIEPGEGVGGEEDQRIVMGLRREGCGVPIEGVQFHPESFLSEEGPRMMANFLNNGRGH